MNDDDDDQRWIIDTCSLSEIHRTIGHPAERPVFTRLSSLVERDRLYYPIQVVEELSAFVSKGKVFPPHSWAERHKKPAARHGPCLAELVEVMADPQLATVLDPTKALGKDEADPHILALALCLKRANYQVTVITEDRRDKSDKLSMVSACGLLRVYSLPLRIFLRHVGIGV